MHAAKENVHHHYDLGNNFYRLWLDRDMVYTCAYFPTPDATLEAAQIAKMDLVCRKLRLQPGERVVEAGCGWGSLALFMARHYGVTVRAFNVSAEQIAYARREPQNEGLADRVEFVEDDYRHVRGTYDAFVSVGMLEHVGARRLSDARRRDRSCAGGFRPRPSALHRPQPAVPRSTRGSASGSSRARIAPTLREVFEHVLEPHDLSVLDVENLRLHYAKTLEHWRQPLQRRLPRSGGDVRRRRSCAPGELYLAGSEVAFTTGSMQLFQVVFARGGSNVVPWTRVSG